MVLAGDGGGVKLTQPRGLAVANLNHDEIPHVPILWRRTHLITVSFPSPPPPRLNANEPNGVQKSDPRR